jgi:hypothetical protein
MQKDTVILLKNEVIISKTKKIRNLKILSTGLAAVVFRLGIKAFLKK